MSIARAGTPGATRVCPHCKAVVLETAAVCPGCRHHLRFSSADPQLASSEGYCAFNIEGTIAHKQAGEHCEYCIVLDIRNERGEQIVRQVVGVGALHPGELRRLNLAVEMLPVRASVAPKKEKEETDPRRATSPAAAARTPAPAAAMPTSRAPSAASAAASPSTTSLRTSAPSPAPPPAPAPAPAPLAAKTAPSSGSGAAAIPARRPAAAPPPAAATAATAAPAPAPEPEATVGQTLQIFRKP